MKNTTEIIPYFRKNARAIAVIYVRGGNKEFQEMMCRLYAADKDYKVAYVTSNLEDVNLCDVLLITNPSRIGRSKLEYNEVVEALNNKGIKVENAIDGDNANENISFLMSEMFDDLVSEMSDKKNELE